jgi:hypothetical protein
MDYLQVTNSRLNEVMQQLQGIIDSEKSIDRIFNYLQKHNELLNDDEYVKIEYEYSRPRSDNNGFNSQFLSYLVVTRGEKIYSINIRKSIIVILAFLFDLNFSEGIASGILSLTGFTTNILQKIDNNEICLIIDILSGNKKKPSDFNYYDNECVQNDIKCPYRDENLCKRTIKIINSQLDTLVKKGIIHKKNGFIKPTF